MENTHYETSIISPVINNTILNGKTYIYKRKKNKTDNITLDS